MEKFCIIGVDVSKLKLDFCVLVGGKVVNEQTIGNHQQSIMALVKELKQEYELENADLLLCAEYTGQYIYPLSCACQALECTLWLENPSQIKYSSGVQRGKNDKVDAKRIALYASRFVDTMRVYQRPTVEIEQLKQLETERCLYVSDLAKYKAQLNDQKEFMPEKLYKQKAKRLEKIIELMERSIEEIEKKMDEIICSNELLSRQKKLLMSVDGVGEAIALSMIILTQAFSKFEDARKFNCFAGFAPFSYTSGSSQHSKNRVSQRANKSIKSLIHMGAVSVTRKKTSDLKDYYLRKIAEGKNKMTVINSVRAKMVARMFAVIKRNEPYVPILS